MSDILSFRVLFGASSMNFWAKYLSYSSNFSYSVLAARMFSKCFSFFEMNIFLRPIPIRSDKLPEFIFFLKAFYALLTSYSPCSSIFYLAIYNYKSANNFFSLSCNFFCFSSGVSSVSGGYSDSSTALFYSS